MEFSNCRIRTKVFPDAPFYLSLLHLELCKQVWKRRASRWLSFDFWLRRAAACSISSTCKLLFFPDNKGCVLYITKCNHPPPPRSFVWSPPPQNSAVDSPDNRASCVIVEGFYYYYSSLENEKFQVHTSKEMASTRGQLKGQIELHSSNSGKSWWHTHICCEP